MAAALLCVAVLSACNEEPEPGPGGTPTLEPTEGSTTGAAAPADPDNAVEPPGPLKDRLYPSDMLIFSRDKLSDSMVKRIRQLPEVAAVEPIGLGQVTIENQALTIAAVDSATYRRFTPVDSAQEQDVWDRVAGGELAITEKLAKRLQDKQGNIVLGNGENAPVVHVGAYAPQATTIDMVVNTAWVDDLDQMVFGNGLLISTDDAAPSVIRKPIQRIVGDQASVQDLDIASRIGLDPNVVQTAFLTGGSIASVVGTFNYTVLEVAGSRPTRRGSHAASPPSRCRSWAASPATSRSSPSCAPRSRRSSVAGCPTRSTPVSTPAATTRASSPGRRRCPTTRSGSPST